MNLHAENESIPQRVDMLDHPVQQHFSREFADDLMDTDDDSAIALIAECDRFHVRIDHASLSRPVGADACVTVDGSPFHAIGPFHVRRHCGQGAIKIAGIERLVRSLQK